MFVVEGVSIFAGSRALQADAPIFWRRCEPCDQPWRCGHGAGVARVTALLKGVTIMAFRVRGAGLGAVGAVQRQQS